jgi:hypothetical protein
MGIIEKIVVSDEALRALEAQARLHGRTIEQEAAHRIEIQHRSFDRAALVERARAFRESLPPQASDSLVLLREDRDR